MDGLGQHLLAGPALAGQADRRIGARHLGSSAQHRHKGPGGADHRTEGQGELGLCIQLPPQLVGQGPVAVHLVIQLGDLRRVPAEDDGA